MKWRAPHVVFLWLHVSQYTHLSLRRDSQHIAFAAYLTSTKTGLAQKDFSCTCSACRFTITREKLAADKFVSDLMKDPKNSDDVKLSGDAVYFP